MDPLAEGAGSSKIEYLLKKLNQKFKKKCSKIESIEIDICACTMYNTNKKRDKVRKTVKRSRKGQTFHSGKI